MTLQQFGEESVVDIHYHKGEQVSTRCVNESDCNQPKTSYNGEAQHQKKGRCATIGNPTLHRLRLHSIMSYSIVWWIHAAPASYSREAQHQKKGRCATIGHPTLERLRGLVLTSWPVQLQRISNMHIGKGYDSSAS